MGNVHLVSQYNRIQSLLDRTGTATWEDIEMQGHWGRYLCVLAAGLLENSIKEVYAEYIHSSSSPHVAKYATSNLERISSPRASRFIQVASSFNSDWGTALRDFMDHGQGERRNAIDSIINNRHQIAHGRNTSISVVRVKDYLQRAVEVIDFIESQCIGS